MLTASSAPAESNFEHHRVETGARKQPQRRQRVELELRQRNIATHRFDRRESIAQRGVGRLGTVDANAFVVAQQMRRCIEAHVISRRAQHGVEYRACRALAVGAADGDNRARELRIHARLHLADAIETERDRPRMQRFEVRKPRGKRRG